MGVTYLSLDEASYLSFPTMTTWGIVRLNCKIYQPTTSGYVLDRRSGSTTYVTKNNDGTGTFSGTTLKWNGVTTAVNSLPFNQFGTLEFNGGANQNSSLKIATSIAMDVYSIQLYDVSETLICDIDMSTGSINDRTASAYNPTVVGTTTWLTDNTNVVLYSDNFDRANSTTAMGITVPYLGGRVKTWTPYKGTWGISSNKAYLQTDTPADYDVTVLNTLFSNCTVQTDVTWNTSTSLGLSLRATDSTNWLDCIINSSGLLLRKMVNTSVTTLGSYAFSPTNATTYTIKAVMEGSNIKVYLNGTLRIDITETFNSSVTQHGLRQPSIGGTWDNFSISANIAVNNYTKGLTDSISLSESLVKQISRVKNLSDTITLSESVAKRVTVAKILSDLITLSETFNKSFTSGGTAYTKSLSDTITLSELVNKVAGYNKSLSDSLSLADSVVGNIVKQIYSIIQLNGTQHLLHQFMASQELRNIVSGLVEITVTLGGGLMASINQNFITYQGDTKQLVVTVKKDDGTALNLTGASITWKFDTTTKSVGSGIVITDAPNGIFTITLNPADTTTKLGNFNHAATVTDASGNVSTVMTGIMTVNKPL